MSEINRRKFLNAVLLAASAAVIAPKVLGSALAGAAEPELPMLDTKDMVADQLKYAEDYKKSPFSGGKKKCLDCQFYAAKGKHAGKDAGTCTIFTGKWVYANAYCNSFTEKKKA